MEGKIKFFNQEKGWGFISGNDGQEYFLHISQLPTNTEAPEQGSDVRFDTQQTEKGMQAQNIIFI